MTTQKRRGHNEGSWTRLNNNKWKLTVTVGYDINGKQIRRAKTGTKRECLEWVNKYKDTSSNSLFYDYASRWLELKKLSLTPLVYARRKKQIEHIVQINNFKLSKCTDFTIANIIKEMRKTRSDLQLKYYISLIRQVLTFAKDKGDIERLPYFPVITADKAKPPHAILVIDEIRNLLKKATLKGGCVQLCLLLGFTTGMRLSEILALTPADIDLTHNTISINKVATADEHYMPIISNRTKNFSSRRTIYVHPQILQIVYKILLTKTISISISNVSRVISRFFRRHKVENVTMHSTRHNFITLALEHNVNMVYLSQYVGHKLHSTTIDVYTHMPINKPNKELNEFVELFLQ